MEGIKSDRQSSEQRQPLARGQNPGAQIDENADAGAGRRGDQLADIYRLVNYQRDECAKELIKGKPKPEEVFDRESAGSHLPSHSPNLLDIAVGVAERLLMQIERADNSRHSG